MKEQILEIKKLYEGEINLDLFNKLMLHSTDEISKSSARENAFNIEEWREKYLGRYANLDVSVEQLILFFDYMSKYHEKYCRKSQNVYSIFLSLLTDRKSTNIFYFEEIVFNVFQLSDL